MQEAHFTTRRGFIAAMGFGGVSLYGLWAAYGAAPGPLALLGIGGHDAHSAPAAGGHGAGTPGPSPEAFLRMTEEFVARYRLPDGTVHPRDLAAPHAAAPLADRGHGHGAGDHGEAHAGGMRPGAASDPAATPHAADHAGAADTADQDTGQWPREVLIAAGKWYYRPHALRLDAGRPYRLRMMAVDVSHGASIQLGRGGRMVRLRPGRLTEMDVAFHAPGRYLVYCTVYCGPAHDLMQATIEVV